MLSTFEDAEAALARIALLILRGAAVYFVSFMVISLIAVAFGSSQLPYRSLGSMFVCSVCMMPAWLMSLPGLRERTWARVMATTSATVLMITVAGRIVSLPAAVREFEMSLWIVSEIGALALIVCQTVNTATRPIRQWSDEGLVEDRVRSILACLPRSIRDDAEAMIREFADRRDVHRAAGRGAWFTLAACGWDLGGYILRSATYQLFWRFVAKLIGRFLGL